MKVRKPAVRAVFVSTLAIAGCGGGDDGVGPDEPPTVVPTRIRVQPAFDTLTQIGQVDTFSVLVVYSGVGRVNPNVVYEVSWASSDPAVLAADPMGRLGVVVTALGNGVAVLRAVEQLSGLTDSAFVTVEQIPRLLEVVSGSDQEGTAGSKLPNPVVIRVTDFGGTAVTGVTVSFAPEDGAGSVNPGSAVSDDEGLVSAEWTLGDRLGEQSIRISFDGGPLLWVRARAAS